MTRATIVKAVTAVVVAGAVATGTVLLTTGGASRTIDVTWSKGQCQSKYFCYDLKGTVDLDLVRVHVDCHGTCDTSALACTGATGRIGKLDVLTEGEDGIKIRSGCHDLTVGGTTAGSGGTVTADARYPTSHQDCVQAFYSYNILFQNVVFSCKSANNAQWYMEGLSTTAVPTNVVCDHCEFHPAFTGNHVVELTLSNKSGVSNSLVCPGAKKALVFDVRAGAISPVDVNNVKPWPAGADARCW